MVSAFGREVSCFLFFNDTATTEIYTLSLHDALPISAWGSGRNPKALVSLRLRDLWRYGDRKSTRLNSSHGYISYAGFCLKKNISLIPGPPAQHSTPPAGRGQACARRL